MYGSRVFGPTNCYKETFNVYRGLQTNADRRKFRFGLKSNIDFLIQLDMENLKSLLLDINYDPLHRPPKQLSDGSFLSTLYKLNHNRCAEFFEIIQRISSNLKFT